MTILNTSSSIPTSPLLLLTSKNASENVPIVTSPLLSYSFLYLFLYLLLITTQQLTISSAFNFIICATSDNHIMELISKAQNLLSEDNFKTIIRQYSNNQATILVLVGKEISSKRLSLFAMKVALEAALRTRHQF